MRPQDILKWGSAHWEKAVFYASLLCLALVLQAFYKDLARFTNMARQDMGFLQQKPASSLLIDEGWVDLLEERAVNAAAFATSPSRNLFSIVEEKPVIMIPAPPKTLPVPTPSEPFENEPLGLVKIYRYPVRLLFKGYIKLPDGKYSLQINWSGQTDFKEVGEAIRGYTIQQFKKVVNMVEIQEGFSREVDNSYVIIRKHPHDPIKLEKGKLVTEKELFAKVLYRPDGKVFSVHVGSLMGPYKVLDITEDEVIVSSESGEEYTLKRRQ